MCIMSVCASNKLVLSYLILNIIEKWGQSTPLFDPISHKTFCRA